MNQAAINESKIMQTKDQFSVAEAAVMPLEHSDCKQLLVAGCLPTFPCVSEFCIHDGGHAP